MPEKGKTVLIVGNGFDLAHGLPTRYIDFLEFCRCVESVWHFWGGDNETQRRTSFQRNLIDKWNTTESIKEYMLNAFQKRKWKGTIPNQYIELEDEILSEIHTLIDNNIWYSYLYHLYEVRNIKGENWIDFESEICYIIQQIDKNSHNLDENLAKIFKSLQDGKNARINLFVKYFNKKVGESDLKPDKINVRIFRKIAYEELEKITRALELYLGKFIDVIQIDKHIPEIDKIKPDYVINFNYTNTYERVYNNKVYDNAEVFHIHGNCDAGRPVEKNNMVLGIDEYWKGDDRDIHTNFTIFKKFAQRIQKHTGIENYKYMKEINTFFEKNKERWQGNGNIITTHPVGISYVYIFGHSLDVTDKDILSDIVGADSTSVIVYCYDKGIEGELIANTIKLIGEEQMLKKANHVPPKLDYVIQEKVDE